MKKTLNYLIPLILLILPTYLIRFNVFGIPSTFLEIYIYLVFLLFIIERVINRQKLLSVKFILPIILLIIGFISAYFADNRNVVLGQVKACFFDGLLVFIMYYCYRTDNKIQERTIIFYLISALFVSLWGILQRIGIIGLIEHQLNDPSLLSQINQGRILGPFESPNYLAMYIAPLVIILILIFIRNKEFSYLRKYILPILIVFGITLILTQSVSSIIAIIVTLMLYLILKIKTKVKWFYIGLLVVCMLTGGILLAKYSIKSGSIMARKEIYKASFDIGKLHPVTGIGAGNFPDYYFRIPIVDRLNYGAMHPHNIFLAFWVYMGWPGLIAFLVLITISLRKENFKQQPLYYFAFLCILINGLTDTTIFKNDLAIIFWYLIAFLI